MYVYRGTFVTSDLFVWEEKKLGVGAEIVHQLR